MIRKLFLLAALSALSLAAETAEATVYIGLSQITDGFLGEVGFAAQPVNLTNGFRAGARLGLSSGSWTGHELTYGFERHDLEVGGQTESQAQVHQFAYDYVVNLAPSALPVRPFVLAGIGFSRFSPGVEGIFESGSAETKFAYNYGGGVKVKLGPLFGLRFDRRDYVTGRPNFLDLQQVTGKLHNIEYSAGLSLRF
jgi:opacity protein-like surface antigen